MSKAALYSLVSGAIMGVIVSGMFLPDWLALNFYVATLYIPPMPILAVVGGIGGMVTNVFVDYSLDATYAGQTRWVAQRGSSLCIAMYAYPFPNPDPMAVPGPRLLAIWSDQEYKASFNRVYGGRT